MNAPLVHLFMRIGPILFTQAPVLALAPMAGYTDVAFRELMAQRGADIVFSELASATAMARSDGKNTDAAKAAGAPAGELCSQPVISSSFEKTSRIIQVGPTGITGIQLFGASPEDLGRTVKSLGAQIDSGKCKAKLIDLNFGCPAPKVTKNGAGSALLDNPKKLADFAKAAVAASPVPVTAKIRLGGKVKNNVAIALALESSGISALTVHGRTAAQKFSGKADWKSIGEVVQAVSIPVFGNGDVVFPPDVARICEISGCQGVMVGRGALADPLFFANARQYLKKGEFTPTPWEEKISFLREYLRLQIPYGLPYHSAKDIALQLSCGFPGASRLREKIGLCRDAPALFGVMETQMRRPCSA